MKQNVIKTEHFGNYVEVSFDSGFKVQILEKKSFSSVYAVFGTKYGSIDTCFSTDNENFITVPEGIAHFLEHKLFESEDGDAFSRFAETGAYCNAYTSFDRTCYLFSCTNNIYENLEILLDFVQSPFFTPETVAKEQGIIGQEIKMYEDNPNWRVLFNMFGEMFEKHPVKIDIAGTVDSIAEITDKLLYDCYNSFYDLSNMCLCIAGNIDADKALEIIKANMKNDRGVKIYRKTAEESCNVRSHYAEQKLSVAGPLFCYGYKETYDTPLRTQREKLVADIMLELLAGDCSPLYRGLIDSGLINDDFGYEYFNGYGYSVIFFEGESRDPKAVSEAIAKEIARQIEEGIDLSMLEAVKKAEYGDRIRRFESLDATVSDMIESAFWGDDIFASGDIIKGITEKDITDRLKGLREEFSVLSVINRKD